MPKSDGNGNYIVSRASFWIGLLLSIIAVGGSVYAWGASFSRLQTQVDYQDKQIVAVQDDIKQIKADVQAIRIQNARIRGIVAKKRNTSEDEAARAYEALQELEPYRGKKGKLKRELGDRGGLLLHLLAEGSPTTAAEFLGYHGGSKRDIGKWWQKLGLPIVKRDCSTAVAPWQRFAGEPTVDEIRARYLNATGGADRALTYNWVVPNSTEYARLVCVADLHYGEAAMDYERWLKLRDWIGENPDVRWLFHGDLYDLATTQSPGRSMLRQAINFKEARQLAEADIEPIADQCVAFLTGNHDIRVARAVQVEYDPVQDLAEKLGIPFLGYARFVRYRLETANGKRRQEYIGYHHHGVGSGQTWGSFFNSLQRLADRNTADFVVMGHRHQRAAVTTTKREVAVDGHIEIVDEPLVGAGCFLKHEGGTYSVEKGYAPSVLGVATVHMYLDRHSVHARA